MKISRVCAQPSEDTFSIPQIGKFVNHYLKHARVSADPFARNCSWATYTNDINPNTTAKFHLDAEEFLCMLRDRGIKPDLVLFDPPYSPRQVKEVYASFGKAVGIKDTQTSATYRRARSIINSILPVGGIVLSFGWSSIGMGKKYNFEIEEILLVAHGGAHNDTICVAERKCGFF